MFSNLRFIVGIPLSLCQVFATVNIFLIDFVAQDEITASQTSLKIVIVCSIRDLKEVGQQKIIFWIMKLYLSQ